MNKALSLFEIPQFTKLTDRFIGFDDLFSEMNAAMNTKMDMGFPPYDIYTEDVNVFKQNNKNADLHKETHTFIKFALAGIKKENIRVSFDDENILTVSNVKDKTVEETIDLLKRFEGRIGILSLDNDLGDGLLEGQEVAKWIEKEYFVNGYQLPTKIIPHTMNPIARKNIQTIIDILYRKG